jgi:uncharacterized membrane protein
MNGAICEASNHPRRLRICLLLLVNVLTPCCETTRPLHPTDEVMLANDGAAGASEGAGAAGSTQQRVPDWCEARAVLIDKCQRCHSDPPEHGAPYPLVTFEDTQRLDSAGNPRSDRIAAAVESDYMPARFLTLKPPVEPLTPDQRELLLAWCRSGTPNAGADCDSP